MALPDLSVRRPVTILVTTAAVATFGFMAARRLPVNLLPDLAYPTLTVQTVYPDAAPVSVEQFVTRPVEEAVGVIPGVRTMRSASRSGLSEVVLEFQWDEDMDFAALDVREKLGMVQLPRESEAPRVLRFDPSLDPILRLALSGDRPLGDLRRLGQRWLKPRLESIRGVAAARVRGGLDAEIVVEGDEDRLAAMGLTLDDLAGALEAENVNQPGGTLKDFHAVYLVRTLHEFETLDQVKRTVVREQPQGRVRVEDVARVYRGHRDRVEVTRSAGREVVELALHREGSANTVTVAAAIHESLAELRQELPEDLQLEVLADQAVYIRDAVNQVWSAALIGGVLAVLVLYVFLKDLASTLIIAFSIPVSVIATFLPMRLAGVSLNIMSLGGLALGVGMLVDSSIVVLEAIDRRRSQGHSRATAAARGASEVAGAVTASTLTTVSVFCPIVFVVGVAGQLFYDLAVTVCFALLASLAAALTLIPALAAFDPAAATGRRSTLAVWDGNSTAAPWPTLTHGMLAFIRGRGRGWGFWILLAPARLVTLLLLPLVALVQGLADLLFPWVRSLGMGPWRMGPVGDGAHWFSRMLTVALTPLRLVLFLLAAVLGLIWAALRAVILVLTFPVTALLAGLGRAYPPLLARGLRLRWAILGLAAVLLGLSVAALPRLSTQLVPDLTQGEFAFQLRLPEGTSLDASSAAVAQLERVLAADPRFLRVFSMVGSLPSSASGRRTLGENLARLDFVLPPGASADAEAAAISRVRQVLTLVPQAEAELVRPSVLSMTPPIMVRVFADDLEVLDAAAGRVTRALQSVPQVVDLAGTSEPGQPEVRVELDRERAASLGITSQVLGEALRRKIRGDVIGQFRDGEERIDIRLRAGERHRDRAADVAGLRLRVPGGSAVPISAVASVSVARGPAAVYRADGARMAEVVARSGSADLGQVLEQVRAALATVDLPAGASVEMAGQDRDLEASFNSLQLMLGLAVFLVYVVMAAQFESLIHPFVILFAVPLGLVGVLLALLVTGHVLSVLVFIGAVLLAGIVVNNAIVLVDAINRRRQEGEPVEAAILGAGTERLRPILMTTTTTVLALLPMALGLGAGDELRAPLAVTVIGGLLASTALTLVVIPCLYRVFSRGPAVPADASRPMAGAPGAPETA